MSIVRLCKATLIGLTEDKPQLLDAIQQLGVLHIIPLQARESQTATDHHNVQPERLASALRYLVTCRHKRKQVMSERHFELAEVINQAERNQQQRIALRERQDFLKKRIKELRPWGSFILAEEGELNGIRLWFYLVPNFRMTDVEQSELTWAVVHRDNRYSYILVLSEHEPRSNQMPVARTHTGAIPMAQLERELEDIEVGLETVEAEREALTRWIYLMQRSVAGIEDQAVLQRVADQTLDRGEIFALKGWLPVEQSDALLNFANQHQMVVQLDQPAADDIPPTLLENNEAIAGGEEIVHFFQMPGYQSWDPSRVVFFSFAAFFALIMSDAGYALLLAAIIGWYWQRMESSQQARRLRAMGLTLALFSTIWGVMVGSYFGAEAPLAALASLKVMDLQDFDSMMVLSVSIGAGHLVLGNLMSAWVNRHSSKCWSGVGWALLVLSALAGWLAGINAIIWLAGGIALLLILLFSTSESGWNNSSLIKRLLGGLLAFTNITKAFGDVLSYLRLFALGLASASLAITFNQLALDVASAAPGIGLFLQVLILSVGHLLNLVLTVVSGVIHGLRLNLIEFYNWSLADEGYAFQPFTKQEVPPWIT